MNSIGNEQKNCFKKMFCKGHKLIFVLLLTLLSVSCATNRKEIPKAVEGYLDLSTWDFQKDGNIKLNGQWEIYWDEFLTPSEIREKKGQPDYLNIPTAVGSKTSKGFKIPATGYGTLRLKIKTKDLESISYGLRTLNLLSASKIWVNDVFLSEIGKLSLEKSQQKTSYKQDLIDFSVNNSQIEIVVHVANYTVAANQFTSFILGENKKIFTDFYIDLGRDIFIFGSLFFMGIFNLTLYIKRKVDKSTLYLGLVALFMAARTLFVGTRFIYAIYPNLDWEWLGKLCFILIYGICSFYFMFLNEFFRKIPKKVIHLTNLINGVASLIVLFFDSSIYFKTLLPTGAWFVVSLIYIFFIIKKDKINGKLFLPGFFIMFFSAFYDLLVNVNIIHTNGILSIGLFSFMFFQSFIIATKFSDALTQSEKLTSKVTVLNNNLELKVEQRTRELSDTLEELKKSQDKIIASEKMAALGQLIAGIAHEINTPLGAIRASIGNIADSYESTIKNFPELIKETTQTNLDLVRKLIFTSNKSSNMLMGREARKIKKQHAEFLTENGIENPDEYADILVDLGVDSSIDFLIPLLKEKNSSELMNAIRDLCLIQKNSKNIDVAVDKAAKVVYALKIYAHHEESKISKPINIEENIDIVLTLYNNQIKHGIEIIKEYEDVPSVLGFADELNQVWTNIIYNAVQAMDNRGTITIKIFMENNYVKVSIMDTGCGIPSENLEKIFEPFFTTKKMGEGTGLGLDIVKKIIDKHNGFIQCQSELGIGTTFTVGIPIIEV